MKKKGISLVMALVLVLTCVIGGTIAWLTAKSKTVTNTFTVGDINIELKETKSDFKMVPGNTIEKDPKVTVKANSETCWLFVKIEESDNLDTFITYTKATGWTALEGVDGVYYREVPGATTDTTFSVLDGDKVTVNSDVTKDDMDKIKNKTNPEPTLTFTAYAVQRANVGSAVEAWAKVATN